jgi:hypothetical protein
MTKKKKLVKKALKNPELYTPAEIQYFKLWLATRKKNKLSALESKNRA